MNFLCYLTIASLALSLASAQSSKGDLEKFNAFMKKYKKSYKDENEKNNRKNLFLDNLKMIEDHNKRFKNGEETYELGENGDSDLSYTELLKLKTGFGDGSQNNNKKNSGTLSNAQVQQALAVCPPSLDWRTMVPSVLPPVKDQGRCGSCWAFAAASTMESRNAIAIDDVVSVSEQNLIDCTYGQPYYNTGCKGGWMDRAFNYVKNNDGISTDDAYSYTAKVGDCAYDDSDPNDIADLVVTGVGRVESGSEAALQAAVCEGPVAVAINTPKKLFMNYKSGIYRDNKCLSDKADHAVVVVGYGTVNNTAVWIVLNSWSEDWGYGGFAYMARNVDNMCGIATWGSYPLIG